MHRQTRSQMIGRLGWRRRGLTRGQGHWADFPEILKNTTKDPLFFVDLPGNGERFQEKSPWKIEQYTEMTRPLVADRIDINATVTLEALVLGAMKLKQEKAE